MKELSRPPQLDTGPIVATPCKHVYMCQPNMWQPPKKIDYLIHYCRYNVTDQAPMTKNFYPNQVGPENCRFCRSSCFMGHNCGCPGRIFRRKFLVIVRQEHYLLSTLQLPPSQSLSPTQKQVKLVVLSKEFISSCRWQQNRYTGSDEMCGPLNQTSAKPDRYMRFTHLSVKVTSCNE